MPCKLGQLSSNYGVQGYFILRDCFTVPEVSSLRNVILKLHELCKQDHQEFYWEEALNSSLIT
jgi:hypothetical protein